MSKRVFYIKMAGLLVIAGLGHRVVELVKTTQVVNNNHTHNYPEPVHEPAAEERSA